MKKGFTALMVASLFVWNLAIAADEKETTPATAEQAPAVQTEAPATEPEPVPEPTKVPQAKQPEPEPAITPVVTVEEIIPPPKTEGLLGPVILGPKIWVGFPNSGGGIEAKYISLLGASFDYGIFPQIGLGSTQFGISAWSLSARVYPFKGALCAGLAFGQQTFTATATDTILATNTTIENVVTTFFLTPKIGWRWVEYNGFWVGVELGYQLALGPSETLTAPDDDALSGDADYDALKQGVRDKSDTFGKAGLPYIGLVQIGFFL